MTTPSADGTTPAPDPAAVTSAPAADAAASQAQMTASATAYTSTRDLATTLDTPPVVAPDVIKGQVTVVNIAASPPTISVQIQGDTTTTIPGVLFVDSYSPVVGDTCLIIKKGTDLFALGQLNNSTLGTSANGWQTPSLGTGFTTNGNSNGPIQYRLVVDAGDNRVQWKGSVAISGGTTAVLGTALVAPYVPSATRTIICARDTTGGAVGVQVNFNTDGTITVTGGTTAAGTAAGTSGSTTPGAGATASPLTTTSTSPGNTGTPDHVSTSTPAPNSSSTQTDANTSNASTGTAHVHDVFAHTHDLQNHTHGMSGHVHDMSSHTHDHDHTHTSAAHTHTTPATTPTVTAPVWISFNDVSYLI